MSYYRVVKPKGSDNWFIESAMFRIGRFYFMKGTVGKIMPLHRPHKVTTYFETRNEAWRKLLVILDRELQYKLSKKITGIWHP